MQVIKISSGAVNRAVHALRHGGVVICPTDTVYGFLADAGNKKAVKKIYTIKRRPRSKPLPVFVKNFAMAKAIAEIDARQAKIIKKYWPGRYTFILKRKPGTQLYGVDKATVALRIPKNTFLQKLLKEVNLPLAQTSVNITSQEPLANAETIIGLFGRSKLVDLLIAKPGMSRGKPSKVMDIVQDTSKVIRK